MAQLVAKFCAKAKCKPPTVEFDEDTSGTEPFVCKLTLPAFFDSVSNAGFPTVTFTATGRGKKAAKGAAMTKASEFLVGTPVYTTVMEQTALSGWTVLKDVLLTSRIVTLTDIRCHVLLSIANLDGWIPVGALMTNTKVSRYTRRLAPSPADQLAAMAAELTSNPPPKGLGVSTSGYSVKVLFANDQEQHSTMNPGFVAGGHGTPEQALVVPVAHGQPENTTCAVWIPADINEPLTEVQVHSRPYYRQGFAELLGSPVEHLARVATLDGPSQKATLEEVISSYEAGQHDKPTASQPDAASPPKRHCGPKESPSRGVGLGAAKGIVPGAEAGIAQVDSRAASPGVKRTVDDEPVDDAGGYGVHAALRAVTRVADCYASAGPTAGPINIRASVIAGAPVRGPMLATRVRLSGLPHDPCPPQYNGINVTVKPVQGVSWSPLTVQDLLQSLLCRWPRDHSGASVVFSRVPKQYDEAHWGSQRPARMLQSLLAGCPGANVTSTTCPSQPDGSENQNENELKACDDKKRAATHGHMLQVTLLDQEFTGSSSNAESKDVAEQIAALEVLHKLVPHIASLFNAKATPIDENMRGGDEANGKPPVALEWERPGEGAALAPGAPVKGEFTVHSVVQGRPLLLERAYFKGKVGNGQWVPAIEEALLAMKANSIATVRTTLPFLGQDPTGAVQRVPVTIRIEVTAKKPGHPSQKIFSPSLAVQRHTLAAQMIRDHACRTVVDFGCGEGQWIKWLMLDQEATPVASILGVDESPTALQRGTKLIPAALQRCRMQDELKHKAQPHVVLHHGSVTTGALLTREGWGRWRGCDAAVVCEVVEHVHHPDVLARCLLGALQPRLAFVSTPNMEYNKVIRFCSPGQADPTMPVGSDGLSMRDRDHKFEWNQAQFREWAHRHAAEHGYTVTFGGVGEAMAHATWVQEASEGQPDVGVATQVAIFKRREEVEVQAADGDVQVPQVFDLAQQSEEHIRTCAKEYVQLRKEMFKAKNVEPIEGADSLLASLTGFALHDDDICD